MQWGANDKEVVQSWMAFKELLGNGVVSANIGPAGARAAEHGWANKWGICTNKYFLERILASPEDFRLGHDSFGFDVLNSSYGCVNPGDLPRMLAERSGKNDIESLFDQQEVAKEMGRLALARENESFTREVQRLEAESRNRQGHSGLRWWMRDFNELPIGPEKLVEHAKILHEQAKDAVRDATFLWGPLCGSVCGVVFGVLYVSIGDPQ